MRKKKIMEYIKQRQFYLALLGCVVVLSVIYIVADYNSKDEQEIADLNETLIDAESLEETISDNLSAQNQTEDKSNEDALDSEKVQEKVTISQEEVIGDDTDANADKAEVVEGNENEATVAAISHSPNITFDKAKGIILPVQGEVILKYSKDIPVYFKTLEQYKVNPALLIKANVGDNVRATAGGIVESISYSNDKGNMITIYHGNGYKSIYGQLKENMKVKEGDIVDKGEIIGFVSEPTNYYIVEGSHVYFKFLENEEPINPNELVK